MAVVHVLWFTDPVDPWSWAAEPSRRRLEQEFGENLATSYVMASLAREFSGDPAAPHAGVPTRSSSRFSVRASRIANSSQSLLKYATTSIPSAAFAASRSAHARSSPRV
jgi:hypothetical protein